MAGSPMLILTLIAYAALVAVNLYKPAGTGDQLVGWGFIIFGVLVAFVLCSLILTIQITSKGRFDWISESNGVRNIGVGILWLFMTIAVAKSTMINVDWRGTETSNWLGLVLIHYGALWLPLLMLIPYTLVLNTQLESDTTPATFKIPLLLAGLIGILFQFMSNRQMGNLFQDKTEVSRITYEEGLRQIGFQDETIDLLYYMLKDIDPRLTEAAYTKLQTKDDVEADLQKFLTTVDENYDYLRALAYLERYPVSHPEAFIGPLNTAITKVSEDLKYRLQSFGSENAFLELLNVDGICKMLDSQFADYRADFRPVMEQVRAELQREPKPNFLAIRNRYLAAVESWLNEGR